jgi:hypothetical protein
MTGPRVPFLGVDPFPPTVALTGIAALLAVVSPPLLALVGALGALAVAAWAARAGTDGVRWLPRLGPLPIAALATVGGAEVALFTRSAPGAGSALGLLVAVGLAALWWAERRRVLEAGRRTA